MTPRLSVFQLGPGMAAYLLVMAFLLGACMGSFLNCAAWRYAHHQSALKGRSRCPACGHALGVLDLIPIVSWLALKGRCRHCGGRVSPRYPVTELACGLLFVSGALRFGISWRAPEYLILGAVLFYLTLTDLETMELPGVPMVIAAVSWCLFLFAYDDPLDRLVRGLVGSLAVAGALLALALVMDKVLGRESLGGGDVKLVALTGLYFGWDGNLLLLILGCILGLALAAALRSRRQAFPFGPALACAAWCVALFGEWVLDRYWGLF